MHEVEEELSSTSQLRHLLSVQLQRTISQSTEKQPGKVHIFGCIDWEFMPNRACGC
jgi:hypothetical protein